MEPHKPITSDTISAGDRILLSELVLERLQGFNLPCEPELVRNATDFLTGADLAPESMFQSLRTLKLDEVERKVAKKVIDILYDLTLDRSTPYRMSIIDQDRQQFLMYALEELDVPFDFEVAKARLTELIQTKYNLKDVNEPFKNLDVLGGILDFLTENNKSDKYFTLIHQNIDRTYKGKYRLNDHMAVQCQRILEMMEEHYPSAIKPERKAILDQALYFHEIFEWTDEIKVDPQQREDHENL